MCLYDSPGDSGARPRGTSRRARTREGGGAAALRRGGARAQRGAAARAGSDCRARTVALGVCIHTLLPRACTLLHGLCSAEPAGLTLPVASHALTCLRTFAQLGQLGLELLEAADDGGAAAPRAGGVSGGVSTPGSTPRTTAHPAAGGTTRSVMRGTSSPRGSSRRTP